jgi:hypothetical protein
MVEHLDTVEAVEVPAPAWQRLGDEHLFGLESAEARTDSPPLRSDRRHEGQHEYTRYCRG